MTYKIEGPLIDSIPSSHTPLTSTRSIVCVCVCVYFSPKKMAPCAPTEMIADADTSEAPFFAEQQTSAFAAGSKSFGVPIDVFSSRHAHDAHAAAQQVSEESSDTDISKALPTMSKGPDATEALSCASAQQQPHIEKGQSKKKRKRLGLRFDSNVTYIDDLKSLSTNVNDDTSKPAADSAARPSSPPASTWWSQADLRSFKVSARSICRKVRERRAFTTCLDVAYQTVSSSDGNNTNITQNTATCPKELQGEATREDLMKLIHRGLTKWSKHGHSCRGLERRVSDFQFTARQNDMVMVRRAIFDEQTRQIQNRRKRRRIDVHNNVPTGTSTSAEAAAEAEPTHQDDCTAEVKDCAAPGAIQQASVARSESARLFARMMGEADAAAALSAASTSRKGSNTAYGCQYPQSGSLK